ncbi:cobalamin biosynthesis protein CbiX [Oceanobacillus oncorhynchi subsp. incaldanensis]|uniref:Sirohydrochlorin cobaltochelatase n=1 Tax=Oceanobacillus oncorhynchi TaxID=545501 RepID=A0A0A1ME85_9BACI|nr:sirohydrochlorin chelatase [Oceanobacillus oncorhynchi]GIO17801.1 cobalamin biosynthesis protein CbiX [Oceanobacillus oncorhynchi subsp. incaldanensis]CEI81378.1 Sirohydrochlorin cobaltochelatase [Oceanobacillus oncorhynchi]
MFDAVVYIGHGSRCEEGEAQFKRFIESVKEEVASPNQEIAFLELTAPTIAETMEKLIADGAKRFLIVPVLLFSAIQHQLDIPEELRAVQRKYPFISFEISEPFGAHPYMVDLVVKRIGAEKNEKDTAIMLVGGGSSHLRPIQELQQIGKSVEQKLDIPVYTAFLQLGKPSLEETLEFLPYRYKKVYVMPYLLFTGLQLEKIEQIVFSSKDTFVICPNLEFDELMKKTLIKRMEEACDGEDVSGDDEPRQKKGGNYRGRGDSSA